MVRIMSKKKNDENEIDGDEKDELLNWNENETFATSEATSRVSDVELLKVTFFVIMIADSLIHHSHGYWDITRIWGPTGVRPYLGLPQDF